jgi:hypothetical protein
MVAAPPEKAWWTARHLQYLHLKFARKRNGEELKPLRRRKLKQY